MHRNFNDLNLLREKSRNNENENFTNEKQRARVAMIESFGSPDTHLLHPPSKRWKRNEKKKGEFYFYATDRSQNF